MNLLGQHSSVMRKNVHVLKSACRVLQSSIWSMTNWKTSFGRENKAKEFIASKGEVVVAL